jgi:5'-nucleotidase
VPVKLYNPYAGLDWSKTTSWDGSDTTTVLGTAAAAISGEDIRYKETPLGNMIADGIAAYAAYTSGETVDFAMLNGQNVQGFNPDGIPAGNITLDRLSAGLGDTLFLVTYTGQDIIDIINIFVNSDAYESTGSGWKRNCVVLVSKGVSYTVTPDPDPTEPPSATDIKVNGTAIDPAKEYLVAVGNFMAGQNAAGGDATTGGGLNFVDYGTDKEVLDDTLKQAVAKYILARGTVNPVTADRITGTVPVKLPAE